eukprot:CAMPEP_0202722316 /NCGR_PEP_ID=MMETSP1385-20130828/156478_1 /ASSEMBLY_ACC=CAM_ASM_000861 /TAXON_ID=933848 /ORGANISM="Elphidium margaritaceum" /LENGTH=35 /DNA_ID= /DNA_START= /DNA_END= /DNA_ORIENTATION=
MKSLVEHSGHEVARSSFTLNAAAVVKFSNTLEPRP